MRSGQRGFVTLAALLIIVIITTTGALLMTSLFGEIQGESGYDQAVGAVSVAEAGLHWAGNNLTGLAAVSGWYAGDSNQTLQAAGGQEAGVFDVTVTCVDGSLISTGCTAAPNNRLIRSTAYVPSKTDARGRRTVQAVVAYSPFFTKTICGYTRVNFGPGVTVLGEVGSEGTASPGVILPSASNTATEIQPGTAPTTQPSGRVCPGRARVWNTYRCPPGSAALSGGAVTISAANSSLGSISLGAGGTVTFQTAGPRNVLTVNVGTIAAGKNTQFIVQGGGTVVLNVRNQLVVGQGSYFGVDTTRTPVLPGRLIVRSCNTGAPSPAISFNQTSVVSAVFVAPYGHVQMDQVPLSQGAVLANTIQFDQGTRFRYDTSASTVGFGFTKLLSWQDVP